MPKTLYEKIWQAHVVHELENKTCLIYVDRHLMHEVTSPQAFEGLRNHKRPVRRPESVLATMDHVVPTINRDQEISDAIARKQVETLAENCKTHGLNLYDMNDENNGIIHVIAPELGFTHPGMVVVCGDSHTATHGAFGALAFGIGTSEVEHVLATQTLQQTQSKTMRIEVLESLPAGSTAKDLALYIIGKIGTAGGTGFVIEFTGPAVMELSMEGRMTLCNMAIEGGARAGMIAPDEKTKAYLKEKKFAPESGNWDQAAAYWDTMKSDDDAEFDTTLTLNGKFVVPQVTWGTSPEQVIGIDSIVPDPGKIEDPSKALSCKNALAYMDLTTGTKITDIEIDTVFIGSCTNGRIEDMREGAAIAKGKKVHSGVTALVVPGSYKVKEQAEKEGLDKIFLEAGFQWREPGCSMCLAMNGDFLNTGQRCASTSNRNFEGRQGKGGRTHLVSPAMAAAAAIEGKFVDIRNWK